MKTNYVGDDAMREQRHIIETIADMSINATDRDMIDYMKTIWHKINDRDLAVIVLTIVYVDALMTANVTLTVDDDCTYADAMSCINDVTDYLLNHLED